MQNPQIKRWQCNPPTKLVEHGIVWANFKKHAKQNEPNRENYVVYDSISVKFLEKDKKVVSWSRA
jgi:hypothetical protein